jgi:hypothetical protein
VNDQALHKNCFRKITKAGMNGANIEKTAEEMRKEVITS